VGAQVRALALSVAAALLAGCAGARVHELGESTYGLIARDDHSVDQARRQAERHALEFCRKRGGLLVPVTSANRSAPAAPAMQYARYELVFECVAPGESSGDPGLTPEEGLARLRAAAR